MKTYSAISVAKKFLDLANGEGVDVTQMKLQKLVFFAQLTALHAFDGIPIHCNETLAWDYGPVVDELYQCVKRFGGDAVRSTDNSGADVFVGAERIDDPDALFIINTVWDKFKGWTAYQLSMLTHRRNSPWSVAYAQGRNTIIHHDLIRKNLFGEPWNV